MVVGGPAVDLLCELGPAKGCIYIYIGPTVDQQVVCLRALAVESL
jgi:hypothetical protein